MPDNIPHYIKTLLSTKNFLALSLDNIVGLPNFTYELTDSANHPFTIEVLDSGILQVEPLNENITTQSIVLSCGIHGNETAPIEILNHIISQILASDLRIKQRLLFVFGNLSAIKHNVRFVEYNLNALFSLSEKNHDNGTLNTLEYQRAKLLENIVTQFFLNDNRKSTHFHERIHLDLHTAIRGSVYEKFAVYPVNTLDDVDHYLLALLHKSDVHTVLFSYQPTYTFCYFSANQYQAKSLTIELGKVTPLGENKLADFQPIIDVLMCLVEGRDIAPCNIEQVNFFEIFQRINKTSTSFKLNFAQQVKNFTAFKQGDLLAIDEYRQYNAKVNGEVILFPNQAVPVGQRALLTAKPITI